MADPHYAWYANGMFIGEGPEVTYAHPSSGHTDDTFVLEVHVSNFLGESGRNSKTVEASVTNMSCSLQ
jgi:hypothetical protein